MATVRETLQQEASALRAQAQELIERATTIEQKLASLPPEIDALPQDAWDRVRDWFKAF